MDAVESARIEGADVTLTDVEAYRTRYTDDTDPPAVPKDIREAVNCEEAISLATDNAGRHEAITRLHEILLDDVSSDGDVVGDFRDHMVHLPSPNLGQRPFVPPTPESVEPLVESLTSYAQVGGAHHAIIAVDELDRSGLIREVTRGRQRDSTRRATFSRFFSRSHNEI